MGQLYEVPLAPEGASVGLDIRVVGNDSGEKVRKGVNGYLVHECNCAV